MGHSGFESQNFVRNGSTYNPDTALYTFKWQNENVNPFNTQYRYNGEAIYLSYNTGQSITNPEARWLQGAGIDEPLVRYGSDGSKTNYHQDARNSAVLTTHGSTGAAVASQQFDAFGMSSQSTGTIEQYGYTGREPSVNGLMYYRARYYSPQHGRFTQRDPKGSIDGINRYAYVRNNPVNNIDPYGTVSQSTNNFTSLNANYFSGGGSSSQTLLNTSSNNDFSGNQELSNSLGLGDRITNAFNSALDAIANTDTFVAGVGASGVLGFGIEGSLGVLVTPGGFSDFDIGIVGSFGTGFGVNVSADVFGQASDGTVFDLQGKSVNTNIIAGPASITTILDRNGGPTAVSVGAGPSLTGVGGSITSSRTGAITRQTLIRNLADGLCSVTGNC